MLESAPCLAVVIPVFNEAATIAAVVKTVAAQSLVSEIIVVDDASEDGTWNSLEEVGKAEPRAKLFRHTVNQGKGAALRTGFAKATAPLVIVQDADLEYDPSDYSALCKPILAGQGGCCLRLAIFRARARIVCFISGIRWATSC